MKPLFIPLMRRWFEEFEAGRKTHEWRRHGARWNAGTVIPGRRAVLSLGYSGPRLEATVVGVEIRESLPDSDTFGPHVQCIVIELADIRPMGCRTR